MTVALTGLIQPRRASYHLSPKKFRRRRRQMTTDGGLVVSMSADSGSETFNPWTVVNMVFHHLVAEGLQPVISQDDPARPASELLRALGIVPSLMPDARARQRREDELAMLRAKLLPEL